MHGAGHAHHHGHGLLEDLEHEQQSPWLKTRVALLAIVTQQRDLWRTFRRHALRPRLSSKAAFSGSGEEGSRITLIGAVVNLLLSVGKGLAVGKGFQRGTYAFQ